jgi:hypothetical protein
MRNGASGTAVRYRILPRWKRGWRIARNNSRNFTNRFLNSVLDNAVSQARIRPFERNLWRSELEADFERASLELANAAPMLQIRARAADLKPSRGLSEPREQKQKRILGLVNERMRGTGASYHQAWIETRAEHPEMF